MRKIEYRDCTSGDVHTLVEGMMYAYLETNERTGIPTGLPEGEVPEYATRYIPRDSGACVGDLYWILDEGQDVYWLSEIVSVDRTPLDTR